MRCNLLMNYVIERAGNDQCKNIRRHYVINIIKIKYVNSGDVELIMYLMF